jgi:hypothetical protein
MESKVGNVLKRAALGAVIVTSGLGVGCGTASEPTPPPIERSLGDFGLQDRNQTASAMDSLKQNQFFNESGFQNWEKYRGKPLPKESILSIADTLINSPEYEGFPDAGKLLKTAATNYQEINQFSPSLSQALAINLIDLFSSTGAVAEMNHKESGVKMNVRIDNKSTGEPFNIVMDNITKRTTDINIEQNSAYGSGAVRTFLIAKEISHFKYMPILKEIIYSKFTNEFDVKSNLPQSLDDFLFNNAVVEVPVNVNPKMSFEYLNAPVLIDWAGYWHVTPALGRMLKQKVFTAEDEKVIGPNIRVLKLAQERGLISEQKPGVFVWKQGVGPFSKEWQQVMRDTKGVPVLDYP